MTNILIKMFVKNHTEYDDHHVRTAYGLLSGGVGIVCNFILFLMKFIIGTIVHSIAITADAFNNLSDAASSIVTFVGFKAANKPSDKEHPFGHGRIEYIAGLIVSFIIMLVGVEFVKSSFKRIFSDEHMIFDTSALVILVISIFIKVWLYFFNHKLGKKIASPAILGTATDARNDVLTTSVVMLSVLIELLFDISIDGYIGILVALFIIYSGFLIAKDTLSPLLGEGPDPVVIQDIKNIVLGYEGIKGVHDIIMHNYGPLRSFASLHVEVSEAANIVKVHELIDQIERVLLQQLKIYAVIHVDPISTENQRVINLQKQMINIIEEINPVFTMHDFRLVEEQEVVNIIFDIVVPPNYDEKNIKPLKKQIQDKIKSLDKRYRPMINIDRNYL